MANAVQAIEDFVALSMDRRRGNLSLSERPRLEALEDVLRDLIDGAHAAPRKLENPTAATTTRARPKVAPAQIKVQKRSVREDGAAPSFGPSDNIPPRKPAKKAEPEVALSSKDKAKVTEINKAERPSGYTPSVNPCFLGDYYNSEISLSGGLTNQTPSKIRGAAEDVEVQIKDEAKVLLGLATAQMGEAPPPLALESSALHPVPLDSGALQAIEPTPAAPVKAKRTSTSVAPTFGPSNPTSTAESASQALVTIHMISGGSKRGAISAFDPSQATVNLESKQGTESLTLREVLAIFFQQSTDTFTSGGSKLVVTLINDRELGGRSPDYAPGVAAMHIVPDDRRGQVSHIWVPAWAVKAIRFA